MRRGDLVTILETCDKAYSSLFVGKQGIIDELAVQIDRDGVDMTFEIIHAETGRPMCSASLVRLECPAEELGPDMRPKKRPHPNFRDRRRSY